MFIFKPVPVRRDVLEKYVLGFMNNDRAKWHKYWENNNHTQDMPSKAWPMYDKLWRTLEFHSQSENMKSKCLLALENENAEFVSSQYSGGMSKKSKSSLSPIRAAEDSDGIYYSEEESPADNPVSYFYCLYALYFHWF